MYRRRRKRDESEQDRHPPQSEPRRSRNGTESERDRHEPRPRRKNTPERRWNGRWNGTGTKGPPEQRWNGTGTKGPPERDRHASGRSAGSAGTGQARGDRWNGTGTYGAASASAGTGQARNSPPGESERDRHESRNRTGTHGPGTHGAASAMGLPPGAGIAATRAATPAPGCTGRLPETRSRRSRCARISPVRPLGRTSPGARP